MIEKTKNNGNRQKKNDNNNTKEEEKKKEKKIPLRGFSLLRYGITRHAVTCFTNNLFWLGNQVMRIGTLCKTRQQRQRERHQTKGLKTKTIAEQVHYNSWYISMPSSAKQQCEMTKFCIVWRT